MTKTHTLFTALKGALFFCSAFSFFTFQAHSVYPPEEFNNRDARRKATFMDMLNTARQQGAQQAPAEIETAQTIVQGTALDTLNPALILLLCPSAAVDRINPDHLPQITKGFQSLSVPQRHVLFSQLLGNHSVDALEDSFFTQNIMGRLLHSLISIMPAPPFQIQTPQTAFERASRERLNQHLIETCRP